MMSSAWCEWCIKYILLPPLLNLNSVLMVVIRLHRVAHWLLQHVTLMLNSSWAQSLNLEKRSFHNVLSEIYVSTDLIWLLEVLRRWLLRFFNARRCRWFCKHLMHCRSRAEPNYHISANVRKWHCWGRWRMWSWYRDYFQLLWFDNMQIQKQRLVRSAKQPLL